MHIKQLNVSALKGILPGPQYKTKFHIDGDRRQKQELVLVSKYATTSRRWYADEVAFTHVLCKEHRRYEFVPNRNYDLDFHIWYAHGKHPRFSIVGALLKAGQQYGEILRLQAIFGGGRGRWNRDATVPKEFTRLFSASRTPKQFLAKVHPWLNITFFHQGRRYRYDNLFHKKFVTQTFTTEDFFAEQNQERRRLMLRRGVDLQAVLQRLKLVAKDAEGKLYQDGENLNAQGRGSLYLYVVCPSTKQEYLLTVPRGEMREVPLPEEKWIKTQNEWRDSEYQEVPIEDEKDWTKTERVFHDFTPAEARRWTFSLPDQAEFVREA